MEAVEHTGRRAYRSAAASMLCVAGFMAIGACASVVDNAVEDAIRAELPRLIGPARTYAVTVSGADVGAGSIDLAQVTGTRIERPGSPVIDSADVALSGVRFDAASKRITAVAASKVNARLLPADVARFLDAKPGVDAVEVSFQASGEMEVRLVPTLGGYALPAGTRVQLRGRFVVAGQFLNLSVSELRVAGLSLGALPTGALEALVNPLVDLSKLPAPSRMDSASVVDGVLVLQASGATTAAASGLSSTAGR